MAACHDEAAGRPDGGACDMAGNYWSAGPSAGRLNRFSADGELLDWIELPIATPTMPCFGDDDMRTIYVTSLDSKTDAFHTQLVNAGRIPVVAHVTCRCKAMRSKATISPSPAEGRQNLRRKRLTLFKK